METRQKLQFMQIPFSVMGKRKTGRRSSQYNNKSTQIGLEPADDAEVDCFHDDTHFDLLLPPASRWAKMFVIFHPNQKDRTSQACETRLFILIN